MNRICYTYLIGWTKYNTWYYGKKTARNCNPDTFWKDYRTSSKNVLLFIEANGEPDVIEIRNTFGSDHKSCTAWESRVLKRIDARANPNFLNKTNGDKDFDTTGNGFNRKGIKQNWFVGYDIDGNCLGKKFKDDPERGITVFGVGYGTSRPQDWCVAYDINGIYIGKKLRADPKWGIEYFGAKKNKPGKNAGLPQDWAIAFDIDKNYLGKVLSSDERWGISIFGQNKGGERSDKGSTKDRANAYDIDGEYVGYVLKSDQKWGTEYFGNRKGKEHSTKGTTSEYFNAYDIDGVFVGKRLKSDPERGIIIFGANTGRVKPKVKQTWACAYDRDGVYVGKVERDDIGWKNGTYFGNLRKKPMK